MKMQILITTQTKEWYGCEDHVGESGHGRYKMKGGADFVVEVPQSTFMYNEDMIREAFNKKYDTEGSFFRYQYIRADPYYEPEFITLDIKSKITN